jgi:hypothetical protein
LRQGKSWAWFGGYDLDFILNAFPYEKYRDVADVERNIAWIPILDN